MLLLLIGLAIGIIGTLIGAGGGFLLVPILLFLYPTWSSERVTGLSMITVALNAISGSFAYFRQKKVHIKAGIIFTIAGIPGAFLGVTVGHMVSRLLFEKIFGVALILYATILILVKIKDNKNQEFHYKQLLPNSIYIYGFGLSLVVGFLASFLGIGGGVIHVPILSQVLGFPVHMAAGTSHFILAVTAVIATVMHIIHGDISLINDMEIYQLGVGVICGAQIGARLSKRVSGKVILKFLAVALLGVGLRLILITR